MSAVAAELFKAPPIAVQNEDSAQGLGRLCWYSVEQMEVNQQPALEALVKRGLFTKPRPINHFDAWRRITHAGIHDLRYPARDGKLVRLILQTVNEKDDVAERCVLRVEVDEENRQVEPAAVASLTLNKDTREFGVRWLVPEHALEEEVVAAVNTAVDRYRSEAFFFDAAWMRRVIARELRCCAAIPFKKTGGVYFVPRDSAQHLDRVAEFTRDINALVGKEAAAVASILLVDSVEHRKVVEKAFDDYATAQLEALESDLREVTALPEGPDKEKAVVALLARGKELRDKAAKYCELLQINASTIEARVAALAAALRKLVLV